MMARTIEASLRAIDDVSIRSTASIGSFDEKRAIDFLIGERDDYPSGRVANSSIIINKENNTVEEGRIHSPTVVQSYALERAGTTETVQEGVDVNVIDNVLHVYLNEGVSVGTVIEVVEAITEGNSGTALERVKHNL